MAPISFRVKAKYLEWLTRISLVSYPPFWPYWPHLSLPPSWLPLLRPQGILFIWAHLHYKTFVPPVLFAFKPLVPSLHSGLCACPLISGAWVPTDNVSPSNPGIPLLYPSLALFSLQHLTIYIVLHILFICLPPLEYKFPPKRQISLYSIHYFMPSANSTWYIVQ